MSRFLFAFPVLGTQGENPAGNTKPNWDVLIKGCGLLQRTAACLARVICAIASRDVFSAARRSRQKTDSILFRACGRETLQEFLT